ncbi:hypothetical protein, partial [Rhizobium johnstonii]|uniref:hypothetical protein n=1 Tax=Rhizobium johnstonii TaxID=3019933 RepID=UPI003F9E5B9E
LFSANTINIGGDLAAMGEAAELVPGSTAASRGTTSSIACQASAHLRAGSYPAGIIVGFANDPP